MPTREKQGPPDRSPMVYFGYWCGPGWSAGREGGKPLDASDTRVGPAVIVGMKARGRPSPIDKACMVHDGEYDAIARMNDPVRVALATVEADRRLYNTISRLLNQHAAGRNDLNMGEVLYGKNVQIAFGNKLIVDRVMVVEALRAKAVSAVNRRGQELVMRNLPYAIVLALGPAGTAPFVARLAAPGGR